MSKVLEGRCNCGDVRYTVNGESLFSYVCHCSNCRKRSGSAFGMGIVVAIESLEVSGELACWKRTSSTGHENPVYRCANCGNVIYGLGDYTPGLAKLMPGTLDDMALITPDVHIWTSHAQNWVTIPDNVLQYEEQPEDFSEALRIAQENRLLEKSKD